LCGTATPRPHANAPDQGRRASLSHSRIAARWQRSRGQPSRLTLAPIAAI
jgi:hypothetical protein